MVEGLGNAVGHFVVFHLVGVVGGDMCFEDIVIGMRVGDVANFVRWDGGAGCNGNVVGFSYY